MAANILPGYDASGNYSGGAPIDGVENHGTACAGIIGAVKNNGQGVAGVSPFCKIIPIHASNGNSLPESYLANSINWAWQNGADIISNSWGGGSPNTAITNAINNATTNGRNGKGCVVVFSSGNNNSSSVNYPGSLSNVIAVGAIDRCGIRSGRIDIVSNSCDPWCTICQPGSAYGSDLDVVAPGTNVYTTDRQGSAGYNTASGINGNYYSSFGGTSAACPHVAGVAALILSVNPNLTGQQVRDIIESSAQKVRQGTGSGKYNYQTTSGHPNGTWHEQMGYGLVDAYAAVQSAVKSLFSITGPSSIISTCEGEYSVEIMIENIHNAHWEATQGIHIISDNGVEGCIIERSSNPEDPSNAYLSFVCTTDDGYERSISKLIQVRPEVLFSVYHNYNAQDLTGMITGRQYYFVSNTSPSSSITNYQWRLVTPSSGSTFTPFVMIGGGNQTIDSSDIVVVPSICSNKYPSLYAGQSTINQKVTFGTGAHCLTLIATDVCGISKSSQQFTVSPAPISSFSMSPNPAQNTLTITQQHQQQISTYTSNAQSQPYVVKILSSNSGLVVFQQSVSNFNIPLTLNISSLPEGSYLVTLLQNGTVVGTQNLLISR
ncbi:hypothetical protein FACS1894153_4520 [Bacteroidia bacterium]|nr:hypothetical protein FACS1894153_4520 [Bacteroidia bacterium]